MREHRLAPGRLDLVDHHLQVAAERRRCRSCCPSVVGPVADREEVVVGVQRQRLVQARQARAGRLSPPMPPLIIAGMYACAVAVLISVAKLGGLACAVVGERGDAVAHEEPGVLGQAGRRSPRCRGRRSRRSGRRCCALAGAAVITILIQVLPVKSSACARVRTWLPVTGAPAVVHVAVRCRWSNPTTPRSGSRRESVDGRAGRILVVVGAAVVPAHQDARRSGGQLDRDPRTAPPRWACRRSSRRCGTRRSRPRFRSRASRTPARRAR